MKGYKEIVGAKIGSKITNDPVEIIRALKCGTISDFLSRTQMKLMASFDLGPNWNKMAAGPTLFLLSDDGTEILPAPKGE